MVMVVAAVVVGQRQAQQSVPSSEQALLLVQATLLTDVARSTTTAAMATPRPAFWALAAVEVTKARMTTISWRKASCTATMTDHIIVQTEELNSLEVELMAESEAEAKVHLTPLGTQVTPWKVRDPTSANASPFLQVEESVTHSLLLASTCLLTRLMATVFSDLWALNEPATSTTTMMKRTLIGSCMMRLMSENTLVLMSVKKTSQAAT